MKLQSYSVLKKCIVRAWHKQINFAFLSNREMEDDAVKAAYINPTMKNEKMEGKHGMITDWLKLTRSILAVMERIDFSTCSTTDELKTTNQ